MPSDRTHRLLVLVSGALLAFWVVAGLIAAWQDWPAEFGTTASDDPHDAVGWILHGSLIHAPLPPLAVQLVATGLLLVRRRGWQIAGAAGLGLLSLLYLVGHLGEPLLQPERSDPPLVAYVPIRVLGVSLVLAMLVLSALVVGAAVRRRA